MGIFAMAGLFWLGILLWLASTAASLRRTCDRQR
jgi:hypothetical protein